jgi:hypothetical protein
VAASEAEQEISQPAAGTLPSGWATEATYSVMRTFTRTTTVTKCGKIILVIQAWPLTSELCESCQTTSVSWAATLVARPVAHGRHAYSDRQFYRKRQAMKSTQFPKVNVHLPGVNLSSIVTFVFLFNLQGGFVQSVRL